MESKKVVFKNYQLVCANGQPYSLGFGAYGSVLLGKCLKTSMTVAIKKITRKLAFNEIEMHMKLKHPNIIQLFDYFFDQPSKSTYLVLEYAENGSLFDYINEGGIREKKIVKGFFNSVCDAVQYMHSHQIMHRDIKPENILLDRKNTIKLCDFGFAAHCEPRMTLCGTTEYMAPQMIQRKPYTHKVDVWALGILLHEMIEGVVPFKGENQEQMLFKMKQPLFLSHNFAPDQVDTIHKILKFDPNDRPQVLQIAKPTLSRYSSLKTIKFESAKRSTADEDREKDIMKRIKLIQVKDLNIKNIQITSIRSMSNMEVTSPTMSKGEKISLKKLSKRN